MIGRWIVCHKGWSRKPQSGTWGHVAATGRCRIKIHRIEISFFQEKLRKSRPQKDQYECKVLRDKVKAILALEKLEQGRNSKSFWDANNTNGNGECK